MRKCDEKYKRSVTSPCMTNPLICSGVSGLVSSSIDSQISEKLNHSRSYGCMSSQEPSALILCIIDTGIFSPLQQGMQAAAGDPMASSPVISFPGQDSPLQLQGSCPNSRFPVPGRSMMSENVATPLEDGLFLHPSMTRIRVIEAPTSWRWHLASYLLE